MVFLPRDKRPTFILLLAAMAVMLIGMLYFGIRLKGFRPGNNVQWSDFGIGLAFDRFGEAYTDGLFDPTGGFSGTDLTIELAIQPKFPRYSSLRFLILINDGNDDRQLVIGQWRSSLIIMNGDDYSNRKRIPKIYFQLDRNDKRPHLITIVSNKAGTRLFLDGVLKKRNEALVLNYPNGPVPARLVVGNSLSGNNPWVGTIMGLAFYDRELEDTAVLQHYHTWRLKHNFSAFTSDLPRLLYAFDEGKGERVYDKLGEGPDLRVPVRMKVLQIKALAWPRFEDVAPADVVEDILINLAGFAPLGFLLLATLAIFEGIGDRTASLATLLFAFSFSLCIEIAQVWIPSRDSSLLDLILNTLGGWMGGVFFKWIQRRVGVA